MIIHTIIKPSLPFLICSLLLDLECGGLQVIEALNSEIPQFDINLKGQTEALKAQIFGLWRGVLNFDNHA